MVKDKESVLFIHVPKCGGSSFEHRLASRGWKEFLSIRGVHADDLNFMRCSPQHFHANLLLSIVNPGEFDNVVIIVRDPVNRLKSEYCWQVHQRITELSASAWIDNTMREYEENNYLYDNHIRPQSEFLVDGAHIFKLEENGVDDAIALVANEKGKKLSLLGRMEYFKKDKLKRTLKNNDINEAFEIKEDNIKSFYKQDYITFNY
jgi:hypothetical protein